MENNYKRRIRQINYTLKQLRKNALLTSSETNQNLIQKCIRRLKKIRTDIQSMKHGGALIRLAAKATFLLAFFQQTSLQAQTFTAPVQNPFGLNGTETFVDLDNDGDVDVVGTFSIPGEVVTGYNYYGYYSYYVGGGHGLYYRLNTITSGEANFGTSQIILHLPYTGNLKYRVADLDNDGDKDVLGIDYNAFYLKNNGSPSNPSFENIVNYPFNLILQTPITSDANIELIDIEGDTDLDFFHIGSDGSLRFYKNNGNAFSPNFASQVINPYGLSSFVYGTRYSFKDLDGDNDLDLFAGDDELLTYYQNTGPQMLPQFALPTSNPFNLELPANFHSGTFTDLDQDGDQDWLSLDNYQNLIINQNNGTPTAPVMNVGDINPFGLSPSMYPGKIVTVDIDHDTDIDVLVMSEDGVSYYENQDILLKIDPLEPSASIRIYPNPGNGILNIELADQVQLKHVQIHDLNGKLLMQFENSSSMDLNSLQTGSYLITVETDKGLNRISWVKI